MALTLNGSTGVVEANIADSAITTSKIAAGAVSTSDLASGAITSGIMPSGSVLQVVQGVNTAWSTTSSQSLVATGL